MEYFILLELNKIQKTLKSSVLQVLPISGYKTKIIKLNHKWLPVPTQQKWEIERKVQLHRRKT